MILRGSHHWRRLTGGLWQPTPGNKTLGWVAWVPFFKSACSSTYPSVAIFTFATKLFFFPFLSSPVNLSQVSRSQVSNQTKTNRTKLVGPSLQQVRSHWISCLYATPSQPIANAVTEAPRTLSSLGSHSLHSLSILAQGSWTRKAVRQHFIIDKENPLFDLTSYFSP